MTTDEKKAIQTYLWGIRTTLDALSEKFEVLADLIEKSKIKPPEILQQVKEAEEQLDESTGGIDYLIRALQPEFTTKVAETLAEYDPCSDKT